MPVNGMTLPSSISSFIVRMVFSLKPFRVLINSPLQEKSEEIPLRSSFSSENVMLSLRIFLLQILFSIQEVHFIHHGRASVTISVFLTRAMSNFTPAGINSMSILRTFVLSLSSSRRTSPIKSELNLKALSVL